ncbi:hypothetical protein CASFOL_010208 [Castilleja foliolosa]|uniref:F-box protein n=1 Tax=Castilleja foliolosa TaxID=1961234 RepID=A0ABD3DRX1_9LAMI
MAGEDEIHLPEPIIQRIQSFLTGKEAARTAMFSKSWHSAWLTRPNLDLDELHFKVICNRDSGFKEYAKETIKRYEQSNLKIESFKLYMYFYHGCTHELAKELIVKSLRIGATRLNLRLHCKPFVLPNGVFATDNLVKLSLGFVLPNEVFGTDNLVELSLGGCSIKLDDGVIIKCRRLESFSLHHDVSISIDTFSKIVSSCPSIENLSILSIFYQHSDEYERVEEQGPRVDAAATAMAVGVVDNLIPKLRCLVLGYESFKTLCLGDLLSRFSFLKDFTLYDYNTAGIDDSIFEEGIQISNCSLERIKLVMKGLVGYFCNVRRPRRPRVKFDVPSVCKFTYEGAVIPCLSFKSTPPTREWESRVYIICHKKHDLSTFWFTELSELLTELSQSKTHLSLNASRNKSSFDYKVGEIIILRKNELENLMIDMTDLPSFSCYALFDGLFRLCRPKLITQYYEDDPDKQLYDREYEYDYDYDNDDDMEQTNIDLLCQTLVQGINIKVSSPTQFMYGLNDLEEVKAQALDMNDVPAEWKPIPLESLLDADTPYKYVQAKIRTRLLLKWKPI